MRVSPLRVGVLDDLSAGPEAVVDTERWVRREAEAAQRSGRLDREVEVVTACGQGLPDGSAAAVEAAFSELDEQGVLIIAGPAIGDNALVAAPLAESRRIPMVHWAGAERARGEYAFHLQVGSHEDEPCLLAATAAATGCRRVALAYDRSPIGVRQLQFLLQEAVIGGLSIAAAVSVPPLATELSEAAGQIVDAAPDAVVYVGLGHCLAPLATALSDAGWEGTGLAGSAGIRGHQPQIGAALEGWIYTDMYSDGNACLAGLLDEEGPDAHPFGVAKGHDLGRLVIEGLARAEILTRDGVRDGLERTKWLPAAEGHDGTLLGFGRFDRGALHGRFLVLRKWASGVSVQWSPPA